MMMMSLVVSDNAFYTNVMTNMRHSFGLTTRLFLQRKRRALA